MENAPKRRKKDWPRLVNFGRVSVSVYRRLTPRGKYAYLVSNYSEKKRRLDSYPTEEIAMEEALALARRLSERDVLSASMTREQAIEFASAVQTLAPFGVSLTSAAVTIAECLKNVGTLSNLGEAVRFYLSKNQQTTRKRVRAIVDELILVKESRKISPRYRQDLQYRLAKFADGFEVDACDITTALVQEWLDKQKASPQGYANTRRVVHLLFEFAVARGYASENPVANVEKIKVRAGDVEIFTPSEIERLLHAASHDFRPCLAIGAFAGLRSTEIERLEWGHIDLVGRHIVIGASRSKTGARRVVPVSDNLAAWLAPYAQKRGPVWTRNHDAFYDGQLEAAKRTHVAADLEKETPEIPALKWKANALRHSYASYRFAQTMDAGRVAGELGNSAAVVHRHYRELVKPSDAEKWFSIRPETAPNVTAISTAAA